MSVREREINSKCVRLTLNAVDLGALLEPRAKLLGSIIQGLGSLNCLEYD